VNDMHDKAKCQISLRVLKGGLSCSRCQPWSHRNFRKGNGRPV